MKSIAAIIQRILMVLAAPAQWIYKTGEWILERSAAVVQSGFELAGDAVDAVGTLPGRVLRRLVGDGAAGPVGLGTQPEQAAANEEHKQQAASRQRADARSLVRAVRSIASALAADEQPNEADIERVGTPVFQYLQSLVRDDLKALSDASTGEIYGMLSVGTQVRGVRSRLRMMAEAQGQRPSTSQHANTIALNPGATRIFAARARRSDNQTLDQALEEPALHRALSLGHA